MKHKQLEGHFEFRFPKEAMDEIREYISLKQKLYRSPTDFFTEAIRIRIEEIKSEIQEKEKMKKPPILAHANSIREQLEEIARRNAKQNAEEIENINNHD